MTVVSQVILKADDELRYPSVGELKSINDFLKTGDQRVRIASTLADNEKKIVDRASNQLWKKRPDLLPPVVMRQAHGNELYAFGTMAGICV
jgi:allophycocyanin-B